MVNAFYPNYIGVFVSLIYSVLIAFAGFVRAAFRICQIRVSREIPAVIRKAIAKIHQDNGALLAKFSRYLVIASQERGVAIRKEKPSSL